MKKEDIKEISAPFLIGSGERETALRYIYAKKKGYMWEFKRIVSSEQVEELKRVGFISTGFSPSLSTWRITSLGEQFCSEIIPGHVLAEDEQSLVERGELQSAPHQPKVVKGGEYTLQLREWEGVVPEVRTPPPTIIGTPMHLKYTTGCTADSLTVDGKEEIDLTPEQRREAWQKLCHWLARKDGEQLNELLQFILPQYGTYTGSDEPCECCGDWVTTYDLTIN